MSDAWRTHIHLVKWDSTVEEPPDLGGTREGMDAMFEFIKEGDFSLLSSISLLEMRKTPGRFVATRRRILSGRL